MEKLILLRHGEAEKNVGDVHGGAGSELTVLGRRQVSHTGRYLGTWAMGEATRLIGHEVPQVRESLEILSGELGAPVELDGRLAGIRLGSVAGLSREEAQGRFPEAAARLEEWREGRRRIDALNLPGGEEVGDFRKRVLASMEDITARDGDVAIIVGTRSTLIMLLNICVMGVGFNYGSYRPYLFSHCSLTEVGANRAILVMNSVECVSFSQKCIQKS